MTSTGHLCRLHTALAYADRVTVIPITPDGRLITIARDPIPGGSPRCAFPTTTKAHPRVAAATTARRLLSNDLGCAHTDLRLVALLDPETTTGHIAVYTAAVAWPHSLPLYAGCGRHRLHPIATTAHTRTIHLQPDAVGALLTGPHLAASARGLPELSCPLHPAQNTTGDRRHGGVTWTAP